MKTLRAGVSRLREELAALLGVEVGEVAGPRRPGPEPPVPDAPVLIGTEAVLHRVRRAAAVAFLDIDLHLLAPRLSATEETLALFVRAGRLVGARGSGAALGAGAGPDPGARPSACWRRSRSGEPAPVLAEEVAIRRASALPPFAALALVSGALAPGLCRGAAPGAPHGPAASGVAVSVSPLGDDRFLLRAPDARARCATSWPGRPGRRARAARRGRPGHALSRSTPARDRIGIAGRR